MSLSGVGGIRERAESSLRIDEGIMQWKEKEKRSEKKFVDCVAGDREVVRVGVVWIVADGEGQFYMG